MRVGGEIHKEINMWRVLCWAHFRDMGGIGVEGVRGNVKDEEVVGACGLGIFWMVGLGGGG